MDQMGEGPSGPDPALPSGEGDGETTRASWGRYPVIRPGLADPANPSLEPAADVAPGQPPTYVPPRPQPPTYIPPRPQEMDQMGERPSGPGGALPSGAGDGEATRGSWGRYPVIRPGLADPANPSLEPAADIAPGQPPTYIPPRPQPPTYIPPTYIPPPPQEMDQMGEGSSGPGGALPSGASDGEATRTSWGRYPAIQPGLADPVNPSLEPATDVAPGHPPTYIPPTQPPSDVAPGQPPTYIPPTQPPSDVVRYGPGVPASVPASQAGPAAERVWRTGRLPKPPRRPRRLRRLFGSALTVILLAASGVVLYLHFHHAPFRVTGVEILKQTKNGCVDDVTGLITTNGAAGTVSYQWVFRPGQQAPQPLSQSVIGGQHALYVTAVVEGQGHGGASQTATLQVLGPAQRTASAPVIVRCS
jgi:hypothetical protein